MAIVKVDGDAFGAELSTAIVLFHEAVARKLGLSAIDHKALGMIQGGPLTASHLAARLSMKPSAVTALVDRLVKAGYAERVTDPADRRLVLIAPAGDVQETLGRIFGELSAEMGAFMSKYDVKETAAIVDWITNSIAVLNRQTAKLTE
ncbi:MAG: MarR family winged helix-turn-helix transcriptional regulator [Stackebrandtia sp.]